MNDDVIYALVETGDYEDRHIFFVKVSESDRDLFRQFTEDTTNITGYEEDMRVKAWTKDLDVEYIDDWDTMIVMTINEYLEGIKDTLDCIEDMRENHYYYEQRDKIAKLLEYQFKEV